MGQPPLTKMRIPVTYITEIEQGFNKTSDSKVFSASLDCPNLVNAEVNACLELPGNWIWNREHGVAFMELYNNLQNVGNVSTCCVS